MTGYTLNVPGLGSALGNLTINLLFNASNGTAVGTVTQAYTGGGGAGDSRLLAATYLGSGNVHCDLKPGNLNLTGIDG